MALKRCALSRTSKQGRREDRVRAGAFRFMARGCVRVDEVTVREWVLAEFHKAVLVPESGPIVGVNAHAGDPHTKQYNSRDQRTHSDGGLSY